MISETNRIWRMNNSEKRRAQHQREYEKDRIAVLVHYGGKCKCCGFLDLTKKFVQSGFSRSYLELDHINGGGSRSARSFRKSNLNHNFYKWLVRHDFPDGFRILCRPCNSVMQTGETVCELHKIMREKLGD